MRRARAKTIIAVAAVVVATVLAGCGSATITYVEDGGPTVRSELETLLRDTSPGDLADVRSEDAADLRTAHLTRLRDTSASGRQTADLITATFPRQERAVPYHVERVTFEGSPAVVILEASGRDGERLSQRRLWVIDDSGSVLLSLMR